MYFGSPAFIDVSFIGGYLDKIVRYDKGFVETSINLIEGYPDNSYFYEFAINLNTIIFYDSKYISIFEAWNMKNSTIKLEYFKPISKEDFYRTDYTQEEARKIQQDYYNHYLQNAPSEP